MGKEHDSIAISIKINKTNELDMNVIFHFKYKIELNQTTKRRKWNHFVKEI